MLDTLWSFEDALRYSGDMKKVALLGSGFSANFDNRYLFPSLFDEADSLTSEIKTIFHELNTVDFEEVIRALCHTNIVCNSYNIDLNFEKEIALVKSALLQAISKVHHSKSSELDNDSVECCIQFLINFDEVFTLNYDLLPYWVLMRSQSLQEDMRLNFQDGFGFNSSDKNYPEAKVHSASLHFLHGALHLTQCGNKTKKLTFKSEDKGNLIDQIRENLTKNNFPLIVSEGRHIEKLKTIQENEYLAEALNNLRNTGDLSETALFSYGVSFNCSDKHILDAIAESNIKVVFVGVYSQESEERKHILTENVRQALLYRAKTKTRSNCKVIFYNSCTASPWRKPPEAIHPSTETSAKLLHQQIII